MEAIPFCYLPHSVEHNTDLLKIELSLYMYGT